MTARDSYHHGDLRRALLDGAVAEIGARGVAGFSLSALARACEVSSAAPYRHFADREALFAEIAIEGYGRLAERLAARAAAADAEAALLGMLRAYLDFAREDGGHFAVMFGGVCDKGRFPALREAGDAALAVLVAAVERVGGTAADAVGFWALAHGFATFAREGVWKDLADAPPIEVAAEAAGRALLAGIRPRGREGAAPP